jgi:hypothetical protein
VCCGHGGTLGDRVGRRRRNRKTGGSGTGQRTHRRREYKCALVRLWHLAGQAVAGGGTRLDQWFESGRNELATQRIEEYFLFGQPSIGLTDLRARPTDVIRCLDQRIAEERKKSVRSAAFEVDRQRYFLVPCSPHGGFEQQQPVRFAAYMRHHRIIADPLLPGVRAIIRDLAGFPALQQELQVIAEDPRQALVVGLGLFNDGHRPEGDCRAVEDDRQTIFFRGTSGDAERLASAREQIDAAEAAGVEVLLFPELTLSPANQQALADELLQRWQRGRACRIPLLVCFLSWLLVHLGEGGKEWLEGGQENRGINAREVFSLAFMPRKSLDAL